MNGWQRVWVVVSVLWLTPFAIALFTLGLPTVYTPPQLSRWTMTCRIEDMPKWPDDAISISNVDRFFTKPGESTIEFWMPEGVDGLTKSSSLGCDDVVLTYNPATKQLHLPVFASLDDWDYARFYSGYDLDSAIQKETQERIDRSKRQRREAILFGSGFAFGVPAVLYALGWAVAWIRRGFRHS